METMYKSNLRHILDMHRSRGETAIFVTQVVNPALVVKTRGDLLVSRPELAGRPVALDAANAVTASACTERPDTCRLIDLASRISLAPGDCYDLVHNTPTGARKIGEFLAPEVASIIDKR
jgi:hypothetical protein